MEIISIGRFDLLVEVLNGLAMLTSDSGPAGYGGMVALGLLIGVIITLTRGIVTQKLELQWILLGWLMYACMYVPKVTVTVRDIYTGATTSVDNVPLGPAAIGSITSQVGVTLADAFGAVFSAPSFTQTGYMDALDLVNSFNQLEYGDANDGQIGNRGSPVSTVDAQRSLNNYLTDCTLYSMSMNLPGSTVSWSTLRESSDLLAAIRVESNTWFATLYLTEGRPDGEVMTCTQAYAQLSAFLVGRFVPGWQAEVGRKLGLRTPAVEIQNAVDSLFGVGNTAQAFMLNALIKKQLELSELGYQAKVNNTPGLIMRTQAMQQRRIQWGAEQSLFQEMARPLMAYIEAFFYAVSPIAAFTFLLGATGVSLFGRYLVLALWIQLWMPIMAINNLYVSMAASSRIQAIGNSGFDPMSMIGLDSVWTQTQSWIATGGMMAAATPLLALMLVTGSYYAFTSLTNRMGGADHINEKIPAPDIMAPAAYASVGAMGMQQALHTNDPMHNTRLTGFENLAKKFNFSSTTSSSVQSAEAVREQAQEKWEKTLSSTLNLSNQHNRGAFNSAMKGWGIGSSSSHTDTLIDHMARSATKGTGLSRDWTEQNASILKTALGVAMQGGKGGASPRAGIDQTLQNLHSVTDQQRKQIGDAIEKSVATDSNDMTQLLEKNQLDKSEGVESRFFKSMGVTDAGQWLESRSDNLAAERDFKRAVSRQESFGSDRSINALIVGNLAAQQGWTEELQHLAYTKELTGVDRTQIDNQAGMLVQTGHISRKAAQGMAAAQVLYEGSNDAKIALMDTLQKHGLGSKIARGDPEANAGLENHKPAFGAARSEAQDNIAEVQASGMQGVRDKVGDKLDAMKDIEAEGRKAVDDFLTAKQQGNIEKARVAMEKIEHIVAEQRAAHYESTFQDTRGPMKLLGDVDIAGSGSKAVTLFGETLGAAAADAKMTRDAVAEKFQDHWWGGIVADAAAAASVPFAIASGASKVDAEYHAQAKSEALAAGLPDAAAQFYAERHMIMTSPTHVGLKRMFGMDEDYEKHKAQAREILGDTGFTMLSRAAVSEPASRQQYLDGAAAIYKSSVHAREAQAAVKSQAAPAPP